MLEHKNAMGQSVQQVVAEVIDGGIFELNGSLDLQEVLSVTCRSHLSWTSEGRVLSVHDEDDCGE